MSSLHFGKLIGYWRFFLDAQSICPCYLSTVLAVHWVCFQSGRTLDTEGLSYAARHASAAYIYRPKTKRLHLLTSTWWLLLEKH
jgi:hypothetical protein